MLASRSEVNLTRDHAGEYHMIVGALVVVLPVTDEYVKTPRFQVRAYHASPGHVL